MIEFSGGFRDLHTGLYEETFAGRGFGIEDARSSVELVHDIGQAAAVARTLEVHPWLSTAAPSRRSLPSASGATTS